MPENIENEPVELDMLATDPLELAKSRIAADFIKREQERYIEITKNTSHVSEGLKSVFIRKIQRMLETPVSLKYNK
ncbi:MAG: hypothetical protein WC528_02435 [Patescibacteria group bacterium]